MQQDIVSYRVGQQKKAVKRPELYAIIRQTKKAMKTTTTFADRLKAFIDYLGITPYEFANKIGSTPQSVHNYVTGAITPRLGNIEKITERYPINPSWLLFGEGEMLKHDYFKARFEEVSKEYATDKDKIETLCHVFDCRKSELAERLGTSRFYLQGVLSEKYSMSAKMKDKFSARVRFIPRDWWD